MQEISHLLASGGSDDYKRVNEIRAFLQNQRTDLPQLTVIYSGKFGDKLTFYRVPDYFPSNRDDGSLAPVYFPCTKNVDCDYLTRFFSGERADVLQKYTVRDDQFYIYIPFSGKEAKFVLLFDRRNSYGKLGS